MRTAGEHADRDRIEDITVVVCDGEGAALNNNCLFAVRVFAGLGIQEVSYSFGVGDGFIRINTRFLAIFRKFR